MNTQITIPPADPRLGIIGKKIDALDRLLVHLLAMRQRMSCEVAMVKIEKDLPIYRKEIEMRRLNEVKDLAEMEGLDPSYAQAILHFIMGESNKVQMILKGDAEIGGQTEKFTPTKEELRQNLMIVTEAWAPRYDSTYGEAHPATKALRDYEHQVMDRVVGLAPDRELLLDLGCATGIESRRLGQQFDKLQGFDISDRMIEHGLRALAFDGVSNIELEVCDIENGIPAEKASVSTLIMNGGTGSDMFNFEAVLREIRRVLKPHGTFMISFYNKESWTQRVFFPWPLGLVARIDSDRNCLEVDVGRRRIPVHAKAYSLAEVMDLFDSNRMVLNSYSTYPTISSILPAEMVSPPKQPEINKAIRSLDAVIAEGSEPLGAYIVVSGRKE